MRRGAPPIPTESMINDIARGRASHHLGNAIWETTDDKRLLIFDAKVPIDWLLEKMGFPSEVVVASYDPVATSCFGTLSCFQESDVKVLRHHCETINRHFVRGPIVCERGLNALPASTRRRLAGANENVLGRVWCLHHGRALDDNAPAAEEATKTVAAGRYALLGHRRPV